MKVLFFLFLMICVNICMADEVVKPGTYDNLLNNGMLELFAGDFPGGWRCATTRPDYRSSGAPGGGGRFIFHQQRDKHIVDQRWSYSMEPGKKYRLSCRAKSTLFNAVHYRIEAYCDASTVIERLDLPLGTTDGWQYFEHVFDAMEVTGDVHYSVCIIVSEITSGTLEIADIRLEPASEKAYRKSIAFLDSIPRPDCVLLYPRASRIQADSVLHFGWFGEADADTVKFAIDGQAVTASLEDNGTLSIRLQDIAPGEHTVKVTSGEEDSREINITVIPAVPSIVKKKRNNFHYELATLDLTPGQNSLFVNPRDGWILFTLPAGCTVNVAGSKHPLASGDFVQLPQGTHQLEVFGTGGQAIVSAITTASFWQLCSGPYHSALPKHTWNFTKKYVLPYVTTFSGVGHNLTEVELSEFRQKNHYLLQVYPIANLNKIADDGTPVILPALDKNTQENGVCIDEVSTGALKNMISYMKIAPRIQVPVEREIATYVCGSMNMPPKYAAAFIECCASFNANSRMLNEIYIPNIFLDENSARENIENRLSKFGKKILSCNPYAMPLFGISLTHSNIPFSFTVDNEPEADHRVLLDMQMQEIATAPCFERIGGFDFYGDNHADLERTRWVMQLYRHYIFEGKTALLSKEYGFQLIPGHLTNAAFRNGLEGWQRTGEVMPRSHSGFASILKQFAAAHSAGETAFFQNKDAKLSQSIKNLKPGKTYKVQYITSIGKIDCAIDAAEMLEEGRLTVTRTPTETVKLLRTVEELRFKATGTEAELALNCDIAPANLHYICVFEYLEE